jgi:hypothetical protein
MQPTEQFLTKVNEFLSISKNVETNTLELSEAISNLSGTIGNLNDLTKINIILKDLDKNINYLNDYNNKISESFGKMNNFIGMEHSLTQITANIKDIQLKLSKINTGTEILLDNTKDINIEIIATTLNDVYIKMCDLNKNIQDNIVEALPKKFDSISVNFDEINNSVKEHTLKISKLFKEYQSSNEILLKNLNITDSSVTKYMQDIISHNNEITSFLMKISQENEKADKYLNSLVHEWYVKNIGFGIKNKTNIILFAFCFVNIGIIVYIYRYQILSFLGII